jgi:hypothetical protein
MHKNAMKCNETLSKWCKNKHGASKIIDMFETYHPCGTTGHDRHEAMRYRLGVLVGEVLKCDAGPTGHALTLVPPHDTLISARSGDCSAKWSSYHTLSAWGTCEVVNAGVEEVVGQHPFLINRVG